METNKEVSKTKITIMVLCSLLITFFLTKLTLFLITNGHIPETHLLIPIQDTIHHIHHYLPGIVLLSLFGFIALIVNKPLYKYLAAICYGIGMALTWDEAIMWIKLSPAYSLEASIIFVNGIAIILVFCLLIFVRKEKNTH